MYNRVIVLIRSDPNTQISKLGFECSVSQHRQEGKKRGWGTAYLKGDIRRRRRGRRDLSAWRTAAVTQSPPREGAHAGRGQREKKRQGRIVNAVLGLFGPYIYKER